MQPGSQPLIVIAVEPSAYAGKWSGNTGTELLGGRGRHYHWNNDHLVKVLDPEDVPQKTYEIYR